MRLRFGKFVRTARCWKHLAALVEALLYLARRPLTNYSASDVEVRFPRLAVV